VVTNPGDAPAVADHTDVLRAHGYHPLRVKQVVQETDDAKSFVLDIPPDLAETFRYEPGQFCTFRVRIDGDEHLRSYSMSSAPETDPDLTVTVKRVPGGLISNWFLDNVSVGDVLETTKPAGVFCLQDNDKPVLAFCGGSGVTPVMSIAKRALVSTSRRVHMLYANRNPESVIFERPLHQMCCEHAGRIEVQHHFDSETGFMDSESVASFASKGLDGDVYICGPAPFMDLVESTLLELGVSADRIFIERFLVGGGEPPPVGAGPADPSSVTPDFVTIIMKGKTTQVTYERGYTILETARRGSLQPPFSCEAGNCATCMAILREGSVNMRANNALTPEEVQEGWILTCQSLPVGATVTVEYESF
jgi:3-ketosteroid 9alpha-monooxygenase subunit B